MAPRRTARKTSSPEKRWRPASKRGPVCGFTFRDQRCNKKGAHYCHPRADRAAGFFPELLVHTKGQWARKQFDLSPWQEDEIIRPLFGEVVWSPEWSCYIRRYRIAYIVLARKNGKSELAAGIALLLLVGDDEESAEIYGAAKDTKQARKVWEPAERMRALSPTLTKRLSVNKNEKRIYDLKTASYYEVITADALGELGHNPHGFVLDEVLSQPDGSLWTSMRTAMGTRTQPLLLAITTETNDASSFGASVIDEAERVQEDPARAPHVFAYVRKTPMDADPWDEANWHHANPALGSFLSIQSLRDEALEAKNDPSKENEFRQYRLNQRVQQVTRWMPLHLWDICGGIVNEDDLRGRRCWGGLDLASTTDLASLVWIFEDGQIVWRFWTPEAQLPTLDKYTAGKASVWTREGLLNATDGDWIDLEAIQNQIDADAKAFQVVTIGHDRWGATSVVQWMQRNGVETQALSQGFPLSSALKELMRRIKAQQLNHGGHPVARWNADSIEIKRDDQDNIKPVKPDRQASSKRIDGIVALAMAIDRHMADPSRDSAYEERGLVVL